VPVIGYTWFPLFTMVDWRYRFGTDPVENYYLELGLYKLNRESDKPRWIETHLVEMMKACIANTAETVGELKRPQSRISDAPSAATNA
jgi:beta-glucosidase